MKSFTLEWWLEIHKKCCGRLLGHYSEGDFKGAKRWDKKLKYVNLRIIEKYGEDAA